jgi:hypothetical protein
MAAAASRRRCNRDRAGLVDIWLRHVRDVHDKHLALVDELPPERQHDRLCELNVLEQVANVCHTFVVQDAWQRGQPLTVHGWIYGLHDGLLRDLGVTVHRREDVLTTTTWRSRHCPSERVVSSPLAQRAAAPSATYLKLVATAVLWGATWIAGRVAVSEAAPLAVASWRFLLAALLLGACWSCSEGWPRWSRSDWLTLTALGASGIFLYNVCFLYGMQ